MKQDKCSIFHGASKLQSLQEYSVPSPYDDFVVLVANLSGTTNTITGSTSAPIAVFVYELAQAEAYGFPAGFRFDKSGM